MKVVGTVLVLVGGGISIGSSSRRARNSTAHAGTLGRLRAMPLHFEEKRIKKHCGAARPGLLFKGCHFLELKQHVHGLPSLDLMFCTGRN